MANTHRERYDPLIPKSSDADGLQPDRLFYGTGVLLDAQDFEAEQLYHRSRLAQVLRYLGGSGTVAGLKVEWKRKLEPGQTDPDEQPGGKVYPEGREEEIRVQPGLAIDRLGRSIEMPRPHCIRIDRWFQQPQTQSSLTVQGAPFNGIVADVFIRFAVRERGRTPAFATGPFDALDAVTPSRLRDGYDLHLVPRAEPATDLPNKLPQNPWRNFATLSPAERQTLIFSAWQGTASRTLDGPDRLPEHTPTQSSTDLFLARLVLPATLIDNTPTRTAGADVIVENQHRLFIYPLAAIAQLIA
jgi:hypothetical protein